MARFRAANFPGTGYELLPSQAFGLAPDPAAFAGAVARFRAPERLREFRQKLHECLGAGRCPV
jgi:hypothetical protein